jgi:hypothetical protein
LLDLLCHDEIKSGYNTFGDLVKKDLMWFFDQTVPESDPSNAPNFKKVRRLEPVKLNLNVGKLVVKEMEE